MTNFQTFRKAFKEKYNQKSLFYTMSIFLSCLCLLLGGYSFFSYQAIKKNATAKAESRLEVSLLQMALLAQKGLSSPVPDFSSAFSDIALPNNCLLVWIKDHAGDIVYYSDNSDLHFLDNIYEKSIHYEFPQISGQSSFSNNYLFYSIPLSRDYLISFAFYNQPVRLDFSLAAFLGVTLFLICACMFLFFYFRKYIYQPIIKIEHAIITRENGDLTFDLSIEENNELYPLATKLNKMFEHMKCLLNQKYSINLLYKQAEIDALQSQINPHFLYNTLDSIRGQALLQNSFEIASLLKSLSNIFRYSISKKEKVVTLADELNHLNNYLTIQQYRFKDKFDFKLVFEEPSDLFLKCQIPKLTIQPIVENAIFHGLETKRGKGLITFYVYRTSTRLIIEIKDNGNGIPDEKLFKLNEKLNTPIDRSDDLSLLALDSKKHSSIALHNVNQRIKLTYGNDFGLTLYSTFSVSTTVQIQLPYLLPKDREP